MAIHNIGLSREGSESADFTKNYKIKAGDGGPSLYLKWTTAAGDILSESFDVAVNYRVVPKVTTDGGGISGWATDWSTWASIKASACSPSTDDHRVGCQWSFNLATLLGMKSSNVGGAESPFLDGNVDLLNRLVRNGSFGFDERYYDHIEIGIHIKANYNISSIDEAETVRGTPESSPRTDTVVTIDYVPVYTIQSVHCDTLDELVIDYTCSDKWLRTDDRFCIESMKIKDIGGAYVEIAESRPWGTVSGRKGNKGVIVVPTSSLSNFPLGDDVLLEVRFNPSYGATGAEFARASFGGPCDGGGEANTPRIMLTNPDTNGFIQIKAEDSGEGLKPLSACHVRLCGSYDPYDQVDDNLNVWTVWPYVQRGVVLKFAAIGFAREGDEVYTSVTRFEAVVEPKGAVEVVSLRDPSAYAVAKWNVAIDESEAPDVEVVKLAGRKRPCRYYGEGGEVKWDLSFDILPEKYADSDDESREAWTKVAQSGDCAMLLRDGTRRYVGFDDIDFSSKHDEGGVVSTKVSLSEVDA
jgi:hypothetical protein